MTQEEYKEAIKTKLIENGLQWRHDFTELLINDLYTLLEQKEKEVKGKIAFAFETNIILDESEDVNEWYNNLCKKMREALKGLI